MQTTDLHHSLVAFLAHSCLFLSFPFSMLHFCIPNSVSVSASGSTLLTHQGHDCSEKAGSEVGWYEREFLSPDDRPVAKVFPGGDVGESVGGGDFKGAMIQALNLCKKQCTHKQWSWLVINCFIAYKGLMKS